MNSEYINLHIIKIKIKRLIHIPIILLGLVILTVSLLLISNNYKQNYNSIQSGIASEVIRFHVIANSDSKEDQILKLNIKDSITNTLEPLLKNTNSVGDARKVLNDNLTTMENLANKIIIEEGFTYSAKASMENVYFPLRVYGDIALPPGEYESVRIELGNSSGKNWWCIMFPPLCFVDSTYSIVPDSSKELLQEVLTDEEYDEILIEDEEISIIDSDDIQIKPKFKIFTFFNDVFNLD